MKLNIKGAADTQKLLKLIEERVAKQGVRKALRAGGKVMRDAIVERTPVLDERTPNSTSLAPGALKADIGVRSGTADGQPIVYVGPGELTSYVAHLVEYGHRMVSGGYSKVEGNGRVRGPGKASEVDVPAHPFIRPAYESAREDAGEAIAEELTKQIREVTN